MDNLKLAPYEAVILKEIGVVHGNGALCTDELILTNLNIIHISKGMFGKIKKISHFPVNQIKLYNGKPQVIMGKLPNGIKTLDVYFNNGNESFHFKTSNTRTINKWINAISNVFVGNDNASTFDDGIDNEDYDPDSLMGQLKEFGEEFRNELGIKKSKPKNNSVQGQDNKLYPLSRTF